MKFEAGTLKTRSLSNNFLCKRCRTEQPIEGRKYVPKDGVSGREWICALCSKAAKA